MKRISAIVCAGLADLLLAGCGTGSLDSMDEGPSGEVAEPLENSNAMNPNAMNPNAMNPNAMNPNALNPSAMSATAMLALQNPGSAGDLSRQLLRYTVSCALDPAQSFNLSWTDAAGVPRSEVYWGLLGLATGWATGPLSSSGEGWVSACLASRVNWYGIPVMLSSRGAVPQLGMTDGERWRYSKIEGAFYGNLFSATPEVYACYNTDNIANSRSQLRDCAVGHLNTDGTTSSCGILQILGPCASFCPTFLADQKYYSSCFTQAGNQGDAVLTVVTVGLK